jgi:hypothetical protein
MTPRRKIALLISGLTLPYIAFFMYFVIVISRHPGKILPAWLAYFASFYIFGSVVLVMVVSHRLARSTPQQVSASGQRTARWARAFAMYLIAVWSGLFAYGAYRTVEGELPIGRAIRAGAILLAFIGLFSWSLYYDSRARKRRINKD